MSEPARAYDAIIAWQRRSRHCGSELRCRLRIWAWRYRNFGGGGPKLPARLHSSSIPELSGNQRSPVAHRELVHGEFAGREVKLPGVLHSFLTVIKGIPAERGVRPNPPAYGPEYYQHLTYRARVLVAALSKELEGFVF